MFRFISIRKITFLGALVFLGFAIASIFIDPNEDGIDGIPDIQVSSSLSFFVTSNPLLLFCLLMKSLTRVMTTPLDLSTTTSASQLNWRRRKDSTEKIKLAGLSYEETNRCFFHQNVCTPMHKGRHVSSNLNELSEKLCRRGGSFSI